MERCRWLFEDAALRWPSEKPHRSESRAQVHNPQRHPRQRTALAVALGRPLESLAQRGGWSGSSEHLLGPEVPPEEYGYDPGQPDCERVPSTARTAHLLAAGEARKNGRFSVAQGLQEPSRRHGPLNEACHSQTSPPSARQGLRKAPSCRAALNCELSGSVCSPCCPERGRHALSSARGWPDLVALGRPQQRTTCWPGWRPAGLSCRAAWGSCEPYLWLVIIHVLEHGACACPMRANAACYQAQQCNGKVERQTEGLRAAAFVRSTRQHLHQLLCQHHGHNKRQTASATFEVCVGAGWTEHARLTLPAAVPDALLPIGSSCSHAERVCCLLHTLRSISRVGTQAREHVSGTSLPYVLFTSRKLMARLSPTALFLCPARVSPTCFHYSSTPAAGLLPANRRASRPKLGSLPLHPRRRRSRRPQ